MRDVPGPEHDIRYDLIEEGRVTEVACCRKGALTILPAAPQRFPARAAEHRQIGLHARTCPLDRVMVQALDPEAVLRRCVVDGTPELYRGSGHSHPRRLGRARV